MIRRLGAFAVLAALGVFLSMTVLPAFAGSDGHDGGKRFAIGFRLNLTGPDTGVGPFSAAGGISESGNSNATFTVTPTAHDQGTLEGTQKLVGSHGSIIIQFRGTVAPFSSPRAVGRAHFRIVSGTGAYAHLKGRGRLLAIGDFTTGTVTGTFDGKVRSG